MDVSPPQARAAQVLQRVKVAVTGLAVVLLLFVVASVLVRSVRHERAVAMLGGSRADLAVNGTQANVTDSASEPLAEIGVAPSGAGNDTSAESRVKLSH